MTGHYAFSDSPWLRVTYGSGTMIVVEMHHLSSPPKFAFIGICDSVSDLRSGKGWVRDSWLSNSCWSPERDFMFHARKEKDKRKFSPQKKRNFYKPRTRWFDMLRTPINLTMCAEGRIVWNMNRNYCIERTSRAREAYGCYIWSRMRISKESEVHQSELIIL
ncbi:hypothetical protein RB195_007515 [Necator americanus]|uniref:Uncharacterized protein n=1 Tax=Necator americanus TaxID=51031 RepID=A0ABR1BYV1_NECAM